MTQPMVGLPIREFLYTLDQIAFLLDYSEAHLRNNLIHFEGRSVGHPGKNLMVAVNIAPEGQKPDWRVSERHLKRWLRFKGYRFYERNAFK
jgi:hypothetical protein